MFEMLALPYTMPLLAMAPRGDGHPVLLLPGFLGDEGSLVALQVFLANCGYRVETWGFGRNVGFRRGYADALVRRLRLLHEASERKVSLVGWSVGGVFAVHAARHAPECVRSVITLGSPLTVDPAGSASPAAVKAIYRMIADPFGAHAQQADADNRRAWPSVPTSCLYSLSDGVVPPQEATIDGDPALHENILVAGSHAGLGINALVLWIVADRLAQPERRWQPYRPDVVAGILHRMMALVAPPP